MGKEDIIPNMEVKVGEKIGGEGGYNPYKLCLTGFQKRQTLMLSNAIHCLMYVSMFVDGEKVLDYERGTV